MHETSYSDCSDPHGGDRAVALRIVVPGTDRSALGEWAGVRLGGVVKYTSDLLTGTSPTVPVAVDVSGGQTLTPQLTDASVGVTSDYADWAEAHLTCRPAERIRLSAGLSLSCPGTQPVAVPGTVQVGSGGNRPLVHDKV